MPKKMTIKVLSPVMDCYTTAGVSGSGARLGRKMPKVESAVGAESPKVWAAPALIRCTWCWAVSNFDISFVVVTFSTYLRIRQ